MDFLLRHIIEIKRSDSLEKPIYYLVKAAIQRQGSRNLMVWGSTSRGNYTFFCASLAIKILFNHIVTM